MKMKSSNRGRHHTQQRVVLVRLVMLTIKPDSSQLFQSMISARIHCSQLLLLLFLHSKVLDTPSQHHNVQAEVYINFVVSLYDYKSKVQKKFDCIFYHTSYKLDLVVRQQLYHTSYKLQLQLYHTSYKLDLVVRQQLYTMILVTIASTSCPSSFETPLA